MAESRGGCTCLCLCMRRRWRRGGGEAGKPLDTLSGTGGVLWSTSTHTHAHTHTRPGRRHACTTTPQKYVADGSDAHTEGERLEIVEQAGGLHHSRAEKSTSER